MLGRDETKRLLSMSETRSQHITAKQRPIHLTLCQLCLPDNTNLTHKFPLTTTPTPPSRPPQNHRRAFPWRAKSPPEPGFPTSRGPHCGHGRFCRTTKPTIGCGRPSDPHSSPLRSGRLFPEHWSNSYFVCNPLFARLHLGSTCQAQDLCFPAMYHTCAGNIPCPVRTAVWCSAEDMADHPRWHFVFRETLFER